jgi:hypothetical protein
VGRIVGKPGKLWQPAHPLLVPVTLFFPLMGPTRLAAALGTTTGVVCGIAHRNGIKYAPRKMTLAERTEHERNRVRRFRKKQELLKLKNVG